MPSAFYANCHVFNSYAEWHYAKCRYAECRGAPSDRVNTPKLQIFAPNFDFVLTSILSSKLLQLGIRKTS
jgi:hypothetical protein